MAAIDASTRSSTHPNNGALFIGDVLTDKCLFHKIHLTKISIQPFIGSFESPDIYNITQTEEV